MPDAMISDAMTAETFMTILPLAIPATVLLTLLAILFYAIRRRRRATAAINHLIIETGMQSDDDRLNEMRSDASDDSGAPSLERLAAPKPVTPAASPATAPPAPLDRAPVANGPVAIENVPVKQPAATAAAVTPAQAPAVSAEMTASALVDRIAAKEAEGGTDGLAQLYLDLARAYRAGGRPRDAQQALQSAAGLGAMHGPKAVHAMARLELGEAAFAAGDRTGACEQWQIAKMEFHEEGLRDAYALTDKRMRDNGCPTDWVLTEF